jgi:N-methylhydantoinase A
MSSKIEIGIDIGGTFTDIFIKDLDSNTWIVNKVPSTPPNFSDGFMNGVHQTLELGSKKTSDIYRIIHGTTVATNTIITESGARVGMLLTEGVSDILQIGYGWRPKMYDLNMDPVEPLFLASRRRCVGVDERIDFQGNVIKKLDIKNLQTKAKFLVEKEKCEVFVVCYLHSYANPDHENQTKDYLQKMYPDIPVTISSEILPRKREYKRLVVSGFDGYVKPIVTNYLHNLESSLENDGANCSFHVMQSNGGVSGITNICKKPVGTALSGLAAGVIGAANVGLNAGYPDCISLDMGGTSTDVALIKDGQAIITNDGAFEEYPLNIPMIDVRTIGAGGSSIAYVDNGGALKVGPESAGAFPGPACYSQGGDNPTVTDASFVLGYLNKDTFAGTLDIDIEKSKTAIRNKICKPLGISLIEAALGIHEIVNSNMAQTLRLVSIKQGHDPREFALMPFGGAGPIHSGKLAEISSIKQILIPPTPGVLSALGLMLAPIQHESMASYEKNTKDSSWKEIKALFSNLDKECSDRMKEDRVLNKEVTKNYFIEMRYVGQSHEIEVPLAAKINKNLIEDAESLFHEIHQNTYSYSDKSANVEFVTLRTVHQKLSQERSILEKAPRIIKKKINKTYREVCFSKKTGYKKIPIYKRADLTWGAELKGPAIIEQSDTTTILHQNHFLKVDKFNNLIIEVPSTQ